MSSTEQKNITHPFIQACKAHGTLAVICANALGEFPLETDRKPFSELGPTPHLGNRLLSADDPHSEAVRLLPVLDGCPRFSRTSVLFLKLCAQNRVLAGNQGVMFMYRAILRREAGLHFSDTRALRHASRHTARVIGYLAPAGMGDAARMESNTLRFTRKGESYRLRAAAECFSFLKSSRVHQHHLGKLRKWNAKARIATGIRSVYSRDGLTHQAYLDIDPYDINQLEEPPCLSTKVIKCKNAGSTICKIRYFGGHYYFEFIVRRELGRRTGEESRLSVKQHGKDKRVNHKRARTTSTLVIMARRDMDDLIYLLEAASAMRMYLDRRRYDIRSAYGGSRLTYLHKQMLALYEEVVAQCSNRFELRNKLGVYFDVLQWRYLAHKSGDLYYDHSSIMKGKIHSKGLVDLPSQEPMLSLLKSAPTDVAIDMLGIYKASIYPEVDPFKVVGDQYALHMSRFQTDWEEGTPEHQRFQETKAYMWYIGVRVIYIRFKLWPGQIREGAEPKSWHQNYKAKGIPGAMWRDAHDIDLTNAVPTADISNEQYMRQQDSACAPPYPEEFASFKAMKEAPFYHKRKILYTIQEQKLPDLPTMMEHLNDLGRNLPDGYTGKLDHSLPFSTDISTGARCERHKDAPRPFYSASSPWGCMLSHFDGITRDFLSHVPQSMLGKSTRQKYMDLQSASRDDANEMYTFYMSDDKAKYSPRMDPNSQQLPADFFAEVFNLPAMKAAGPIMYHNELYYRVDGHLVHYNSNGTDREGMRGSANTWLEIVAQGLSTRLCREKKLVLNRSLFLSFIDDGLRKFTIETTNRTEEQCDQATREVIEDVIFGLRVLGRELSWDKSFISREMYIMLNEIVYRKAFVSSGLKSFCTIGDIELKELMTAADYEQLYFGKMRGAHGVGTPVDLCHYAYVFEVVMSHYKMGLDLQDKPHLSNLDYRLFCITPIALGGAGLRSMLQMSCNEVASATKEGIGNLLRLGKEFPPLMVCVESILSLELERIKPLDFMREPEQMHVPDPRIKTQRMATEVRQHIASVASNSLAKKYIELDTIGQNVLTEIGKVMMAMDKISAEEVRLLYASSPVAFIDNFIQKLVASSTVSQIVGQSTLIRLRKTVRNDLIASLNAFPYRCNSRPLIYELKTGLSRVAAFVDFIIR